MSKDETKIGDLRDMIQIVIEGQNKLEENQDKFLVRLMNVEDNVNDNTKKINKMEVDLADVRSIVEKDAKDQADHKLEHISNIAAHDRFERRISKIENKVEVAV